MVSSGSQWLIVDRCVTQPCNSLLYNRVIGMPAFVSQIKYICDGRQVKGFIGFIGVGTIDPNATQHCLLSPCRQYPCQLCDQKVCQSCQLTSAGKMRAKLKRSLLGSVDLGTNDPNCLETLDPSLLSPREHKRKTLIPASELGSAPMEVKVRGHKNIIITKTQTIYSSVYCNYRRLLMNITTLIIISLIVTAVMLWLDISNSSTKPRRQRAGGPPPTPLPAWYGM